MAATSTPDNGGNVPTRQFSSSSSGISVPVEIVDTIATGGTSHSPVLQDSNTHDEESMEISIEEISQNGGQSLPDSLVNNVKTHPPIEDIVLADSSAIVSSAVDSTQLTPSQHISNATLTLPGISANATPISAAATPTLATQGLSLSLDGYSQLAIQQFQEVSRSLRNEGIELSPENLASHFPHNLAESLAASLIGHSSQSNAAAATILESVINQSAQGLSMDINYSDIDVTRVINDANLTTTTSSDRIGPREEMDTVLSESHVNVPSSPESNFDTSDLLNNSLTQDMEVTTKLANAGPVGVAAAAAILSGRKRKKHVFESNPALRKRHCSKLMRRLKETLDELSTRVGLQACVVTYRPSSKQEKPEPSFRIFGTSPLHGAIEEQKGRILNIMDEQLRKQIPTASSTDHTSLPSNKQISHELPPLVFEGIPTPVHEMTQAQLRCFVPNMLKYSTGRGKPGWGKEDMKPVWWPSEVPWQNVRSDTRSEPQKKALSWTECLRKVIISCYTYHDRVDLLQAFNRKSNEESDSLQLHGIDLGSLQDNVVTSGDTLDGHNQGLMNESQQVFTIDTGMGNCDTSGMPTLADASLAETAARLQQVADETGQVQYATQTVTVTEGDSKALGQPVGSTTTVLLTAYPSGHATQSSGDSQYYQPPITTSSVGAPSVQVVYSASHVSELPESLVSNITSHQQYGGHHQPDVVESYPSNETETVQTSQNLGDSADYFASHSTEDATSEEVNLDLASQYISGYNNKSTSDATTDNKSTAPDTSDLPLKDISKDLSTEH